MAHYYDKYINNGSIHWKYYKQKHGLYYPIVEAVMQRVPRDVSVLDLGCGDGIIDHLLASQGCKVIGIDVDATGIKLAKENTSKHEYRHNPVFKVGDVTEIGLYKDMDVDVGISIDVIEHLTDPMALLQNMFMVCGSVVIGTPEKKPDKKVEKYHVKEYSKDELTCALIETGFRNIDVSTILLRHKEKSKSYLLAVGRI